VQRVLGAAGRLRGARRDRGRHVERLHLGDGAGFTKSNLAALPPAACAGLYSADVAALTTDAVAGLTGACLARFGSHNTDYACDGLAAPQIAAIPATTFRNITAACIAAMEPAAFAGFHADTLGAVPGRSCAGLYSADVAAITPDAMAGLSAPCLANFASHNTDYACSGFSAPQIAKISTATIGAGMTAGCMSELEPGACPGFAAAQIAAVPAVACAGLNSNAECVSRVTVPATAAWTGPQIAQFGKACAGFSADQVAVLTAGGAVPRIDALCTGSLECDGTAGLLPAQAPGLSPVAMHGFTDTNVPCITNATLGALDLATQYEEMSTSGIAGFTVAQWSFLLPHFGAKLVSTLSPTQTAGCSVLVIEGLKSLIEASLPAAVQHSDFADEEYAFPQTALPIDNNTATWLFAALLARDTVLAPTEITALVDPLRKSTVEEYIGSALAGIRADLVPKMTEATWAAIAPGRAGRWIIADTFSAVSDKQLAAVNPVVFGNVTAAGIDGIPTTVLHGAPSALLARMKTSTVSQIDCAHIAEITEAQAAAMSADARNELAHRKDLCENPTPTPSPTPSSSASPSPSPNNSPSPSPTAEPSPSPVPSPSPSPSPSPNNGSRNGSMTPTPTATPSEIPSDKGGLNPSAIIGIALGSVAGVAIIGLACMMGRRSRATPSTTPLLGPASVP
jgi:hypothetical protein